MIKFQYITSDIDPGLSSPLLIDYYSTSEVKERRKIRKYVSRELCKMWRELILGTLKENNCLKRK